MGRHGCHAFSVAQQTTSVWFGVMEFWHDPRAFMQFNLYLTPVIVTPVIPVIHQLFPVILQKIFRKKIRQIYR